MADVMCGRVGCPEKQTALTVEGCSGGGITLTSGPEVGRGSVGQCNSWLCELTQRKLSCKGSCSCKGRPLPE